VSDAGKVNLFTTQELGLSSTPRSSFLSVGSSSPVLDGGESSLEFVKQALCLLFCLLFTSRGVSHVKSFVRVNFVFVYALMIVYSAHAASATKEPPCLVGEEEIRYEGEWVPCAKFIELTNKENLK